MATTPQTHVRFGNAMALSPQSPYSDAGSSASTNETSTFQYVNAQLIAHGFTRTPGLSLEGLSSTDGEKVTRCLLAMLEQVATNTSQSEQLGSKLRTLTYENERLSAMYQEALQQLASAERETSSQKSRMNAANKSLQASEAAHKATTQELQRLKSTLQTVRQTHAAELKRREKESERMIDRWTKVSDSQLKVGSATSGIGFRSTLANSIADSRDDDVIGKGDSLLEHALEDGELARKELIEEIGGLKGIILASANELARTVHSARRKVESVGNEAPFFTMTDLFPPTPLGLANENFKSLLETLRETLKQLSRNAEVECSSSPSLVPERVPPPTQHDTFAFATDNVPSSSKTLADFVPSANDAEEVEVSSSHEDRAKALVRRAVNLDADNESENDKAVDSNAENRQKTNSKSRVADRVRQKRSVRNVSVDDGLPLVDEESIETFDQASTSHSRKKANHGRSPFKKASYSGSPRSPMKTSFVVGKTRMRSALKKSTLASSLSLGQPLSNVIPSIETEVIPDAIASGSLLGSASQPLIVSSMFVLPPPSPMASIPPQPDLLSPLKQPSPAFSSATQVPTISPPDHAVQDGAKGLRSAPTFPPPHPFPVAKPLAKNMFHAYSPARPSPLSRILMLADSPVDNLSLSRSERATEEARRAGDAGVEGPAAGRVVGVTGIPTGRLSLESELGIDDDVTEESSPLRERSARVALALKNGKAVGTKDMKTRTKTKPKNLKKFGKSEKENEIAIPENTGRITPTDTVILKTKSRVSPIFGLDGTSTAAVAKKPNATNRGGARRVPIGSADAAPIGPGWK